MSVFLRATGLLAAAYLLLAATLSQPASSPSGTSYAHNPPTAHTGGFGEPTCRQCHFAEALNAPGGTLALEGVPETYRPGEDYPLTVRLGRAEMGRAGFELAARLADGAQAGTLRPADASRAAVTTGEGVQYAHHTEAGTTLPAPDSARWSLVWTAPDRPSGPVFFHFAANAANDDASEFGDFVYADSLSTRPH